jgi:hypothetical protein
VLIDKTKRPEEIDTWLKHGRKFHAMPLLANTADTFGMAWVEWWAHLQPEWRGEGPDFCTDVAAIPEDAPWPELQKGGPNGFFLVLLSYCWWGAAALDPDGNEIEPTYSEWIEFFPDIQWVLEQMVNGLDSTSLKRLRDDKDEDEDNQAGTSGPAKRFVFLTFSTPSR